MKGLHCATSLLYVHVVYFHTVCALKPQLTSFRNLYWMFSKLTVGLDMYTETMPSSSALLHCHTPDL